MTLFSHYFKTSEKSTHYFRKGTKACLSFTWESILRTCSKGNEIDYWNSTYGMIKESVQNQGVLDVGRRFWMELQMVEIKQEDRVRSPLFNVKLFV